MVIIRRLINFDTSKSNGIITVKQKINSPPGGAASMLLKQLHEK